MHWIRGEQGIKLCLYLQLWIQSSGWDGLMTFELTKDTQLSGCYCPMSWLTTNRQPLCCYYRHINKSQTLDCPTVFTDMSDQTADTSCTVISGDATEIDGNRKKERTIQSSEQRSRGRKATVTQITTLQLWFTEKHLRRKTRTVRYVQRAQNWMHKKGSSHMSLNKSANKHISQTLKKTLY